MKKIAKVAGERPQFCFVIGPMNKEHMPKLRFLAKKIVEPVLPKNFVVKTPDEFGAGNVMNQVMASCDTAALVIADTTGNNPNVLYEVGVLDSLGRLCIPVKLKPDAPKEKRGGTRKTRCLSIVRPIAASSSISRSRPARVRKSAKSSANHSKGKSRGSRRKIR